MSAVRSTIVYNIRNYAGGIFSINQKYFGRNYYSDEGDRAKKSLLGYNETEKKYDLWAPILFSNNVVNMREVFRNEALPQV